MASGAWCRSLTGKASFCTTSDSAEADWEISNYRPDCKLTTTIASMSWIPSIAASRYFTTTQPQEQLAGASNEVDLGLRLCSGSGSKPCHCAGHRRCNGHA